ncbi:glycolate oxidase subunit GlcE [Rhodoferax sp. AJA081-3]|uniref:glycolate oxidase subunit GlcE n=1 Tax=Rhodoferax sp. AJA081-3 TaxID=2752316 RepID=UPI001ADF1C19|nr:glycolate oxidase subunit GlcE [Rhodoferax sp. AJA081-3]QTN26515.1 glycolate oxidase subunit GlcE [Rhodoferax sp. AJA081-3]
MAQTLHTLTDQIRAAAADGTALRIRGGGSKDFYGNSLKGELLDTRGLNGILSYEPSELVVTVAAGTPLAELEAVLAERGQCLAFEPPHFHWSPGNSGTTVGGMVAAGLSGPARASAGAVREYVLGLHMVNGLGEHLVFGGQVMKNVAGYDVSRMMAGSMGTLGLITQVSLKVLPVAPAEATLVFALDQARALECLHTWGGQPLPLNASCWIHDNTASPAGQDLLFVRLRGAVAAVEAACQKMLTEQTGQRMDNTQAQGDWALCRDQQLPFFQRPADPALALWRISVAQTAPAFDTLPWPQMVEWHGGLRWLWAPVDAGAQLHTLAQAHGGNATVFIAYLSDLTGARGPFSINDPAQMAIQQRLKQSLDPHRIFNPQRLFPAW